MSSTIVYTEYHNIIATMIQQKWRQFNLQNKLNLIINPTETCLKKKHVQSMVLLYHFNKIHQSPNFKTMIVKFDLITENKIIEISYKGDDFYSIYDLDNQTLVDYNNEKIIEELNKIINIVSIKIQAVTCDMNFYGYPELTTIKVY